MVASRRRGRRDDKGARGAPVKASDLARISCTVADHSLGRVRSAGPLSTSLPEASRTAVTKTSATEQVAAESGGVPARSSGRPSRAVGASCTGAARASAGESDEAGAPCDEFALFEGGEGDKASPEELLNVGGTGKAGVIRDVSADLPPGGVIVEVAGSYGSEVGGSSDPRPSEAFDDAQCCASFRAA